MIVFATRNKGKLRELQALIGEEVKSLADFGHADVVEDAETFEGNADKKAQAALALSGLPSVGDDSGLEVEALDGAPGVRSARFAAVDDSDAHDDAANNRKLLQVMQGKNDRRARFRCVLVYRAPGKRLVAEGECKGTILTEPRGTGGFGYDPLFLVDGMERTMAELTLDEKNRLSHRARAFAALIAQIKAS